MLPEYSESMSTAFKDFLTLNNMHLSGLIWKYVFLLELIKLIIAICQDVIDHDKPESSLTIRKMRKFQIN